MNYQCQVDIHAPLQLVVETFLDTSTWEEWQPGFIAYEPIEGKPFEPGSKGFLHFLMGDQKGRMRQEVIENKLPDCYVVVYEFESNWNRCVFQFKESGEHVIYTMDSEFRFPGEPPASKEVFIETTTKEMERFKTFVEGKLSNV